VPTPPVTVLADAGPAIGLGHLSRAGAVAAALRVRGHEVATVVIGDEGVEHDGIAWAPLGGGAPLGDGPQTYGEPLPGSPLAAASPPSDAPQLVLERLPGDGPLLVDSYRVDLTALAVARPVATFWDGAGEPPRGARLAIALSGPDGPRLACLRPMFWGTVARPIAPQARRIVVATGGGAAGGVAELAATVAAATPGVAVAAVLGPYADEALPAGVEAIRTPPRMVDVLQDADLVVTAAGQTMLETLCAGTPCVATAVVDNQRAQLDLLAGAGGVHAAELAEIGAAVAALLADAPARARLATTGRQLIDGFGALRVAGLIAEL
jgi:spore coat polysaccharide biosynthesis predicted glycosyltransferase SpsG